MLCFGEVLYDVFPSYRRMGGAPFNFAYHVHSFGLSAMMISRVGDDRDGRGILDSIKNGLDPASIQRDPVHETGKVLVETDEQGIPDFDIVENVAYDYIEFDESVKKAISLKPDLIYFGTLAQRNSTSRRTLDKILSQTSSSNRVYDMNLRQDYFTQEIVSRSLQACSLVKLNDDELQTCKSLFERSDPDESFVHFLMERFDLEWVCLTKGEKGSELFHKSEHFATVKVPEVNVVDTVGAGDAYTSILALGILNKWPSEAILDRATEFAGAICAIEGAIPQDPRFYDPYLPWIKEDRNGH